MCGLVEGGGDNLPNLIEVGEVQISIGWGVRENLEIITRGGDVYSGLQSSDQIRPSFFNVD